MEILGYTRCPHRITVAELNGFNPKKQRAFEGIPHRALDDAKHQARYVADTLSALYYRKAIS